MIFNSSKLQDAPASLSICQTTVTFSDSVRNLGFYMDKNLSMKQHINFIYKTAFFELRRISTIRQHLTVDATKTFVVSLVLSRIGYCNSLLAGLPLSLISKLQRVQNCASSSCSSCIPELYIPHQYSLSSTGYLSKLVSRTKLPASVSVPLTALLPLISLISFISILLFDQVAPVLTPVS